MRVLAQNADFRLERHAVSVKDAGLNLLHQFKHVACACAAAIDDETGVLFTHLRIAHGQAAQAAVIDQLGGEIAFRTLEGASGAGVFQRLLFAAGLGQFIHARLDLRGIAGTQLHVTSVTTTPARIMALWR